jgi:uncharacterized phage infection (PIP) family protein YhgE
MKEFELQPLKTPPIVWNFNEIKAELEENMKKYASLVYTDDTIKEAKKDRALLNKVVKELNDKKVAVKNAYCAPYYAFENQVKELQGIVQDVNTQIDAAVKDYEARKKAEKVEQIKQAYEEIFADWLDEIPLEKINQPYWTNASISMKQVTDAMKSLALMIREDLKYIDSLDADRRLAVKFDYFRTLKLHEALNANKAREDFEKKQKNDIEIETATGTAENIGIADKYEITLRIVVTDETLDDLLDFMKKKGIELIL